MERYGYWNKILHVDLSERRFWIEEPGDEFFRHYGGGRGFIAHYLLKYVPKGIDALHARNVLIFAPGVLTGAPAPAATASAPSLPSPTASASPRPAGSGAPSSSARAGTPSSCTARRRRPCTC